MVYRLVGGGGGGVKNGDLSSVKKRKEAMNFKLYLLREKQTHIDDWASQGSQF